MDPNPSAVDPLPVAEAGTSSSVEGGAARVKCLGRRGRLSWGAAAASGRMAEMEDAHAVAPEFLDISCGGAGGCAASSPSEPGEVAQLRFFGVYDGHGGSQVIAGTSIHVGLSYWSGSLFCVSDLVVDRNFDGRV